MGYALIIVLAAILIVGAVLFALISRISTKKYAKTLNVDQYRVKYLEIENRFRRDDNSSYHLAILNADILVDQALRESGIDGETMGERLKNCTAKFSDLNGLWSAHKLRNRIAHESDVNVTYDEARFAMSNFKKALKELGAI